MSPWDERPAAPPDEGAADPPLSNIEAECALLGGVMVANRVLDDITFLRPEHFAEPLHGRIYQRILDLHEEAENANPVTLKPYFEHDEDMQKLGGPRYLARLTGSGAALIGYRDFAHQIQDLWRLRRLVEELDRARDRALDTSESIDPEGVVAALDAGLADISVEEQRKTHASFASAWDDVESEWREIEGGAEPKGFTINLFHDWNDVTGRMEAGDLILLGARPSMGKSSVGFKVGAGAADAGHGTGIIGVEMDKRRMTRRMMADLIYEPGVTSRYEDLQLGRLTMDDHRALESWRERVAEWPLEIADPDHLVVEQLGAQIRMMKRRFEKRGVEMKLLVLDYLGLIGTMQTKWNSTADRVSYISRTIKQTLRREKVAGVVLAQLNRSLESRDDKRPILADLRESGSLEQDADAVIFLYRDEYYLQRRQPPQSQTEKFHKWTDELAAVKHELEIYSSKRREGGLRKKIAKFISEHVAVRSSDFYQFNNPDPGLF